MSKRDNEKHHLTVKKARIIYCGLTTLDINNDLEYETLRSVHVLGNSKVKKRVSTVIHSQDLINDLVSNGADYKDAFDMIYNRLVQNDLCGHEIVFTDILDLAIIYDSFYVRKPELTHSILENRSMWGAVSDISSLPPTVDETIAKFVEVLSHYSEQKLRFPGIELKVVNFGLDMTASRWIMCGEMIPEPEGIWFNYDTKIIIGMVSMRQYLKNEYENSLKDSVNEFISSDCVLVDELIDFNSYSISTGEKIYHVVLFCFDPVSGDRHFILMNSPKGFNRYFTHLIMTGSSYKSINIRLFKNFYSIECHYLRKFIRIKYDARFDSAILMALKDFGF